MRTSKSGFTIVELLIVIVVIGILAAITIVAYNGIQNRARASSVSSALHQINSKLALYSVDNNSYPADLATAGITNSNDVTYQYSYDNTATPATYCVTATSGSISYKSSSTSQTPTVGGCAGHGTGGAAAITNLATNPSVETTSSGYGANGTVSVAQSTDRAYSGTGSLKVTTTGTTNVGAYFSAPLTAGKIYTLSGYIYFPASFGAGVKACAWGAAMSTLSCSGYSSAVGAWQRASYTFQATNTASGTFYFYNAGTQPTIGSVMYVDGVMLTEGSSLPAYADGDSPNWIWNGNTGASTSTGPAL
jgi:prepilin-type N-terminal cleavage/methylation domain-containing protein